MPTFDVYNLIRKAVRVTLLLLTNPLTVMITLATAFGVFVAWVINHSLAEFVFSVQLPSFVFNDDSGLYALASYCLNLTLIRSVVSASLEFLQTWVIGMFASLAAFIAALWVRNGVSAKRQTVTDNL